MQKTRKKNGKEKRVAPAKGISAQKGSPAPEKGLSYNADINGSICPSPSPAVLPRSNSLAPSPYIGVCYGRLGSNLPVPREVVAAFYKWNNIQRMRLYDPDLDVLQALRGSNIEVMLGVSNSDFQYIAVSQDNADTWIQNNVRDYDSIKFWYIVVGNLAELDIKVSTATDTKAIGSYFPSSNGSFRSEYKPMLDPVIHFLVNSSAPLLVNLHPYSTYITAPMSLVSILLSSHLHHLCSWIVIYNTRNIFDALLDTIYATLKRSNGGSLDVVVSESGWPSAGGMAATTEFAGTYKFNLLQHVKWGTLKKPGRPVETYIFAMFDENNKEPEFEKHWGLFLPNMQPKHKSRTTPIVPPSSDIEDPEIFGLAPNGTFDPFPPKGSKKRTAILVGIAIGGAVISGLGFTLFIFWRKGKKKNGITCSCFSYID
ncbi:hypothetical protein SLEP1_g29922 [Rubroshorea leprosula]|uniref:glucan endo-1,3-beta-D-glucosidase n=1 Tax=Rubroshorea leprosula TaxID=152421 RepID=A0AAV5K8U8_9ROSI|nr:hypothetical protein SLEP1_g29922 [Rubroshorea leprosula]